MRVFSHRLAGTVHLGTYRSGVPVDLGPGDLRQALRDGRLSSLGKSAGAARALEAEKVEYAPLLPDPGKIICVGLNYRAHRAEAHHTGEAKYPDFFLRVATTLTAHNGVILRPRLSQALDWEGELVVVIGKRAKHVEASKALDAVAGYSIFNEASIRDYQFRASQWTWGKNFDRTGAFGPDLVTPDELPRSVREGLHIETRLNGKVMQSASTADLIFDVPTLIAMLSEGMTLEPGDVIVSGTPSGVGFARKPPIFMAAGDKVEVEIEGVGVLHSRVEDEA
ncbi:MAG TPA: fumarylacetoacetate hydrolase family protein [Nevskiaceae bacterium]